MIKLGFETGSVDGWPPFEIEHLWLEPIELGYLVKNTPFYIRGISYGDEIEFVSKDGKYADSWNLIKDSGNSTIWIMEIKKNSFRRIVKKIQHIGCFVESGIPKGYYSITVPVNVSIFPLESLIEKPVSAKQMSVAYATLRHIG